MLLHRWCSLIIVSLKDEVGLIRMLTTRWLHRVSLTCIMLINYVGNVTFWNCIVLYTEFVALYIKSKSFTSKKKMFKIFQLKSKSFESNFSNDWRKLNRLFNSSRITLNLNNISYNLSDSIMDLHSQIKFSLFHITMAQKQWRRFVAALWGLCCHGISIEAIQNKDLHTSLTGYILPISLGMKALLVSLSCWSCVLRHSLSRNQQVLLPRAITKHYRPIFFVI